MSPEDRALDALYALGGKAEPALVRVSRVEYHVRDTATGAVLANALKYKLHARERRGGHRHAWRIKGTGILYGMRTVRGKRFAEIMPIVAHWLGQWTRRVPEAYSATSGTTDNGDDYVLPITWR